jgi:hypothetical protein
MAKLKLKKKKAAPGKKKSEKKPMEQRRYEYEVAKREKNLDALIHSVESYNKTQEKRNRELPQLYKQMTDRRARLQRMVDRELKRQAEKAKGHPVLERLGVGLKLPALAKVFTPKDIPEMTMVLRTTPNGAAKKKKPKPTKAAQAQSEE